MQTLLKFTILNRKTKERTEIGKYYEGFLPFSEGTIVTTGLYMLRVERVSFSAALSPTLTVDLDEAVASSDQDKMNCIAMLERFGWEVI
jgi:hypothetical protein